MFCYLYSEPIFFFFFPKSEIDEFLSLLYYTHIPTAAIALIVGLFVFLSARKFLLNKILFALSICFSLWILVSLTAWTNIHSDIIIFVWPFFALLQALISILSIYFIHVFTNKDRKDVGLKLKVFFLFLLAPVFLFAHTNLSVSGFNITNCDAFGYEGQVFKYYYTGLEVLAMIWVFALLAHAYKKSVNVAKKQILLMGIGMEFFLLSFFSAVFIVTSLVEKGIFTDSNYEWYGLLGMAFFMTVMGILIVRFKTFNVSTTASKALILSLIILVSSQFTYAYTPASVILTAVTLFFTGAVGILLIKSVNLEIEQRKQLEHLTERLSHANSRLKELDKLKSEFVSIASHQLRSPLTAIRGYASLLLDGNYGHIPLKAKEPLDRISISAKNMAYSIEDYLNVSRIESGNMKYNTSDFNLKNEIENVTDDLRSQAVQKGLVLLFRSDVRSKGIVHADLGKVIQIIQNLINNAIKYTPEGSIKVLVRDDVVRKRIFVDIADTGVGIPPESLDKLFGKFERASNANKTNIHGTGLGLFVAQQMAVAMGGDIKAYSEGENKGSRFTVEFPLAM